MNVGKIYKYDDCILAYLDILGFKEKVESSEEYSMLLKDLIEALQINESITGVGTKGRKKIDFRGFFFSDSFVFVIKKEKKSIPHLFLVVRYVHDKLLEHGLILRGSIVDGELYWPESGENLIIGPAMIKAYELESKVAIYPRIITTKSLYEYIEKENITAVPLANKGLLKDFIKRDEDSIYFFDVLNTRITRKKGEWVEKERKNFAIKWNTEDASKYGEVIKKVEGITQKQLDMFGNKDLSVAQKYEWLLTYIKSVGRDANGR